MRRIIHSALALCWALSATAQVSFGDARLLNDDWLFLRADTSWNIVESPEMRQPDFDDARWRHLQLPHDWATELPMSPDKGSCQGYLGGGVAWYRRHLKLSRGEDTRYFIYFEGVYAHSEVYLNGHLLGRRPSGFSSFLYDMTPHLQDGDNVLAVRVDHTEENDARWYTGSGINRNVWLVTAPSLHLAQWGTAYRLGKISAKKAEVEVDVETCDQRKPGQPTPRLQAIVQWKDADGRVVATAKTDIKSQERRTLRLSVPNPRRWTLSDPYLYTLETLLLTDGRQTDRSVVRAGLRTLEFSPMKGFALNGQWMKVKGVCLHDDAGSLGTAVPAYVWRRRLEELKLIGVNAIRMSHNPHTPELYDLCDELGLLVMDEASDEWEFPKRKWLKGWNQGVPGFQGTYRFFEQWIDRDVADMVRRDRCHPSVFLWSIGNEVDYPNDPYSHPILDGGTSGFTQPMYGGYKPEQPNAERIGHIAQRLARVVRDIDTSRPVTGALAGVVMSNETLYPEAIDVVGYNYTESRYLEDHARYPQRVIYGSENRHDLDAWKAVRDNEHIFGQFLWTGIDYLGESGTWPARGSSAGLLDLAGHRKPNGWYRASLWSDQPVCYIGTYPSGPQHYGSRNNNQRTTHVSPYALDTWNYEPGQPVRVVCYTNAPDARLTLNGQPVGGPPQRDPKTDILYWDIEYQPGTLRCETVGNTAPNPHAPSSDLQGRTAFEIHTTKAPHALRLTSDGGMHLFVEVVDEDGHLVRQADNEVTLTVRGARLLGMENGNMMTPTSAPSRQPRLRVANGRLVAYIHSHGSGPVRIQATSPYLRSASLTLDPPQPAN